MISVYISNLVIWPVKQKIICVKLRLFSYPSGQTYVFGAQKNRLIETVLLSTHNICFGSEIRKIIFAHLSGGLIVVNVQHSSPILITVTTHSNNRNSKSSREVILGSVRL